MVLMIGVILSKYSMCHAIVIIVEVVLSVCVCVCLYQCLNLITIGPNELKVAGGTPVYPMNILVESHLATPSCGHYKLKEPKLKFENGIVD